MHKKLCSSVTEKTKETDGKVRVPRPSSTLPSLGEVPSSELHAVESGRATAAGGCAVNGSAYDMSGCMIRHGSASYSMGMGLDPPKYKIHRSNCLPFARLCLCDLLNRVLMLRVLVPHQTHITSNNYGRGRVTMRDNQRAGVGKEKKRNMEQREQKKQR